MYTHVAIQIVQTKLLTFKPDHAYHYDIVLINTFVQYYFYFVQFLVCRTLCTTRIDLINSNPIVFAMSIELVIIQSYCQLLGINRKTTYLYINLTLNSMATSLAYVSEENKKCGC